MGAQDAPLGGAAKGLRTVKARVEEAGKLDLVTSGARGTRVAEGVLEGVEDEEEEEISERRGG